MKIFNVAFNYTTYNKVAGVPLYNIEENPVVFNRPDSTLIKGGKPCFIPDDLGTVKAAAHIVVRVCRLGKGIPERFAHRYYDALTCGMTFTATDLLEQLRREGLPWHPAIGFDGAAAIGEWLDVGELRRHSFRIDINGATAQEGDSCHMLHTIDSIISHISRHTTLRMGDLVFTGAPAPLFPVCENQHVIGFLDDRKLLEFNVK
ncbi:MAG: fumarylacetoacetate hydrolase family protein [Prevotella sp.]|nr:fumarylacetoacetate hydrolase family protein [Prevotella sp.]